METSMPLQQVRRLGFCKQTAPWPDAVLGPGHFAKIHSSGYAARRNSEMYWLAHVSSHVFDLAENRGYRVQSHAGTVATFNAAIHVRCLHAGHHSGQTCRPGSRLGIGVPERIEWNLTIAVLWLTLRREESALRE